MLFPIDGQQQLFISGVSNLSGRSVCPPVRLAPQRAGRSFKILAGKCPARIGRAATPFFDKRCLKERPSIRHGTSEAPSPIRIRNTVRRRGNWAEPLRDLHRNWPPIPGLPVPIVPNAGDHPGTTPPVQPRALAAFLAIHWLSHFPGHFCESYDFSHFK